MSTIVAEAKREQPEQGAELALAAPPTTTAAHPTPSHNPAVKPQATPTPHVAITENTPGFKGADFEKSNRIHIKDGSLFYNGFLTLNPRELEPTPEKEKLLKEKLALTLTVNNPSFYEDRDRLAVALNLAQILPVSLEAQHSKLLEQVKKYNDQVESGADAGLQKQLNDKQHPFAAIVRDTVEKPAKDPVGVETLKNGVAIYLLMREKLTRLNFRNPLTSYVPHTRTPDQVLSDLGEKIGVSPLAVREAALKGGIDGVGQLLGLDAAYIADVKQLTNQAASQEFSLNLIEHWHLGRQLLKDQVSTFAQKIATGLEAHITHITAEARARFHNFFDVAAPIKQEENRIAEALNLVDPIQRALMFKLGYEICYTPDVTADGIAFFPGIYGLHRKAANDLRDTQGTYHIYFSGRGDLKGSMRTLVHEIAHNLWPEQFTPQAVARIDTLATNDGNRYAAWQSITGDVANFTNFEKFVRAYNAGNAAEKAAVIQSANAWLAPKGLTVDGLFPYLRDAHDFQYLVKHAYDTLRIEGARYAVSGYDSSHERFREIISRYAELRQVEYKSQPELLHFLAPGMNEIWETEYLPHLHRVYDGLMQVAPSKNTIAGQMQSGLEGTTPVTADGWVAPKVEQRPEPPPAAPTVPMPGALAVPPSPTSSAPTQNGNADACMGEGAAPDTNVVTNSIELNPQTLAAMSALGLDTSGFASGRG